MPSTSLDMVLQFNVRCDSLRDGKWCSADEPPCKLADHWSGEIYLKSLDKQASLERDHHVVLPSRCRWCYSSARASPIKERSDFRIP